MILKSTMDLKQLEYFVRVAELGSFSRAAAALDVAQPALSRQVRLLEIELRQTLLTRNGRGAVPTEAGKLLLEHGLGILHQVQRAKEDLDRSRGGLTGRVALGLPTSLARLLAVPLARAFRAAMPQASLSISEGLSAAMQAALRTGQLDMALLYNTPKAQDLELELIAQEPLYLVQRRPPGLPEDPPPGSIALRDVAALPLVIPTKPNAIRMQVETAISSLGASLQVAMEIDGVSAMLDFVLDGAGAAILSQNAVQSARQPGAFTTRLIEPPALISDIYLATSAQRPITRTQQQALVLLRNLCVEKQKTLLV
jgi:LysR family transcriptional regulator, nitrogen assimilation regulatory protein